MELCDIRNTTRLSQAFEAWHPDVVLHAAAHKHVPFMERNPCEAVKNNILGTRNVLEAAQAVGARTFVNISTDKAVNPTNVLGASKRMAEAGRGRRGPRAGPSAVRQRAVRQRPGQPGQRHPHLQGARSSGAARSRSPTRT